MNTLWIFDGHNLIHGIPLFRGLLSEDPSGASAQRRLVEDVLLFSDVGGADVRVAFDSRHTKTLSEKWQENQAVKGVEVYYGSADEQADTLIERWVLAVVDPSKVSVVTNDREICSIVEAAGAFSVSISEYQERVKTLAATQQRRIRIRNLKATDDFQNGIPL